MFIPLGKKALVDRIVRQLLECVVVESKESIKVVFVGGLEVREQLTH